jgi:hypothetical protein
MRSRPEFFDGDDRLKGLSDLAGSTEGLSGRRGFRGGRPPFDPAMTFKPLVIQTTANLSYERAAFLIDDRLSFLRFMGLGPQDRA